MQIKFTLGTHEEPEAYAKVRAILDVLSGQAQAVRSGGAVVADAARQAAEAETLAKLEAENPQFGRQPLPPGAVLIGDDAGSLGMPGAPLLPLAPPPPGAPSPAAAETSASAPAATLASTPPPPSAASPVPSPPSAAATHAPVDVDKNGLPWDERIHASSRAKIADGSWRMKRGVQSHVVAEVEAQLRGQSHGSAALDADALKLAAMGADPGPSLPAVPPPPAAPVAGAGLTFGQLAKRVGAKITLGELTAQDLAAKMAALGFPGGLHEANARPDMWATILETLGA